MLCESGETREPPSHHFKLGRRQGHLAVLWKFHLQPAYPSLTQLREPVTGPEGTPD